LQEEGRGEEFGDSSLGNGGFFCGEKDDGVRGAELVDGLAAGSAGLAGGLVEVGDGDGADADLGAMESHGGGDGVLLGADGETVGGVLYVASGDDVAAGEKDGSADAEVAVRGVGIVCRGDGSLLDIGGQSRIERSGMAGWHESEAIGCEGAKASRAALMVRGVRPI
jgi:hypothetical protein